MMRANTMLAILKTLNREEIELLVLTLEATGYIKQKPTPIFTREEKELIYKSIKPPTKKPTKSCTCCNHVTESIIWKLRYM
jgi:hypothetical protein